MSKRKVVLAGACRTAIGTMGGQLSSIPAPDLGALAIKEALKRAGVKPEQVDEVYMGNVIQAGLGQNPARQAAINAGIPVEVPAITINVLCGSGLHCVNLAAKLIENGNADIVVAGGMESMSRAPYLVQQGRFGYRMGNAVLEDSMIRDALTDAFGGYHMGITAENIAEEWGLTREQLDEFAAWSQQVDVCIGWQLRHRSGAFANDTVDERDDIGLHIGNTEWPPQKQTRNLCIHKLPRNQIHLHLYLHLPDFFGDGMVSEDDTVFFFHLFLLRSLLKKFSGCTE